MQAHAPHVDLAFLTAEAVSMQQAYASGIDGCWDDCWARITSWGFDLAQISVPVLLLHGAEDQAVPFSHGQWLAAHIPGVEPWLFDSNRGHTSARMNEHALATTGAFCSHISCARIDQEPRHTELAERGNLGHCAVCPFMPQSTTCCRGVQHVVVVGADHPSVGP